MTLVRANGARVRYGGEIRDIRVTRQSVVRLSQSKGMFFVPPPSLKVPPDAVGLSGRRGA